jgi:hypothetical protein
VIRVRVSGQGYGEWSGSGFRVSTVSSSPYPPMAGPMADRSEPAAAGTAAGAAALRRVGLGLFRSLSPPLPPPRGEASGEISEGMPTRSVYLRRCGGDVAEMWGRCVGDVWEMCGRCVGDVGEIWGRDWGDVGEM